MDSFAIKVENLSKVYHLNNHRATTLKEHVYHKMIKSGKVELNQVVALDQVSFEVNKGEALGIIGRNGSGKSTLLKVLSGITAPTSGKIEISGRVASVLDLGMGFHPDLSGLENIYLSGELLGMKRGEIKQKITEIIEFSEIGRFIDTQVKYYSSGMFIRLAFSVIANLEADILLLDEVISVGDAAFQIKSYKKMQELLTSGRTILLVSHNLNSLSRFTERCLFLQSGKLAGEGNTQSIIAKYAGEIYPEPIIGLGSENSKPIHMRIWDDPETAPGNEFLKIHKILVRNEKRTENDDIFVDEEIVIEVGFRKLDSPGPLNIALRINDFNGSPLFIASPLLSNESDIFGGFLTNTGYKSIKCIIQNHLFNNSFFSVDLFVFNDNNIVILTIPYIIYFSTKNNYLTEILNSHRLNNLPIFPLIKWEMS